MTVWVSRWCRAWVFWLGEAWPSGSFGEWMGEPWLSATTTEWVESAQSLFFGGWKKKKMILVIGKYVMA